MILGSGCPPDFLGRGSGHHILYVCCRNSEEAASFVIDKPSRVCRGVEDAWSKACGKDPVLRGSWDLVTRVIIKVTILITTYNPN